MFPRWTICLLLAAVCAADGPETFTMRLDAQGFSVEELEAAAVLPLERALLAHTAVRRCTVRIRPGEAELRIELGGELPFQMDALREALEALPDEVSVSYLAGEPAAPAIELLVCAPESARVALSIWCTSLAQELARQPGVGGIELAGTSVERLRVALDLTRLAAFGLSIDDVQRALGEAGMVVQQGSMLRGEELLLDLEPNALEVEDLVLTVRADARVLLRDVGELRASREARGRVAFDGRAAVWLGVVPGEGEEVAPALLTSLRAFEAALEAISGAVYGLRGLGPELPGLAFGCWGRCSPLMRTAEQAFSELAENLEDGQPWLLIQRAGQTEVRFAAPDTKAFESAYTRFPGYVMSDAARLARVTIRAPEREALGFALRHLQIELTSDGGLVPFRVLGLASRPALRVELDEAKLRMLGLSPEAVRRQLGTWGPLAPDNAERLADMLLSTPDGAVVPLQHVASIQLASEGYDWMRDQGQPAACIELAGTEEALRRAAARLPDIELPAGVDVSWQQD